MHDIVFEFTFALSLYRMEFLELQQIDPILSDDRFKTLQTFVLDVVIWGVTEQTEEAKAIRARVTAVMTSWFPELNRRGVLVMHVREVNMWFVRHFSS